MSAHPLSSADLIPCVAIVVAAVATSLSPPAIPQGGDTVPGRFGAAVLACGRAFELGEVEWIEERGRRGSVPYFVNISADRRELVSGFGPAPAVLGAPAFLSLQPGAPVDDDELIRRARRASAIAVALCGALGYLALRATATRAWSVLGAFTVLVAFSGCATLAQGLWQQTAALVPVMASVAALAWSERRPRWLTVGPALIGAAALIRPADFPLALGLFVAWVIMAQRARLSVGRLVGSCALAAAVASPWLLWNLVYVDSLLPLGQLRSNVGQAPGGAVFSVMPNRIVPALVGALVSPARGLVWYAPIVLLGVVLAARADGVVSPTS
jgi:hypothetical protein